MPANFAVFLCMRSRYENIKISVTISEIKATLLRYCFPRTKGNTVFVHDKPDIFYKNIEVEVCEILNISRIILKRI